ncbi:MAG TPA: hypothetical protein VFZ31_02960 [Vicinamibacterales bacterium]
MLVIRHTPWLEWLVGGSFIAGGAWAFAGGERVFGGGFILVAIVLIAVVAVTVTSTFDPATRRFTRSVRGLVRRNDVTHSFDDIQAVRVQAGNSGSTPSQSYRVALVLRSGADLPISAGYSSGKADKERIAAEIRRVLGLPEAPELEPFGIRDMVKLMRDDKPR